MSVPIDFMNTSKPDDFITDRLIDLQDALGVSDDAYTEFLGIGVREYEKIRNHQFEPSIYMIDQLCQSLNIDFDTFVTGRFDTLHLKKNLGQTVSLPDRYADPEQWLARGRTIMGFRNFLESNYGAKFCRSVFRRVQVEPDLFQDTESYVSPHLVSDLLASFASFGFHVDWAREIGLSSYDVNRETMVHAELSKTSSISELYRICHESLISKGFDRLFEYRMMKLFLREMAVEVLPRKEPHLLFGVEHLGDHSLCVFKQGVYLSFARHGGFELPKLTESACMYLGDDRCRYHFSW